MPLRRFQFGLYATNSEISSVTSQCGLILHVSATDGGGGAAIAAKRLVIAQRAAGINARMLVMRKVGSEDWVEQIDRPLVRFRVRIHRFIAKRIIMALSPQSGDIMSSAALISTGLGRAISWQRPALVHLHWVGGEVLSLAEFTQFGLPVVWTCHDQWAWCGAEHYGDERGFVGSYRDRPWYDANRINFMRKVHAWRGWHPTLICPSDWIRETASQSVIAGNWPAITIANTLDMDVFRPLDRDRCRSILGLPLEKRIVLFGADHGTKDPRKGFDLLEQALTALPNEEKQKTLVVTFGGKEPTSSEVSGVAVRGMGPVYDEDALAQIYNTADVFVAPSRQDNLPNTLLEAQACGVPCAGFRVGGLPDIISADDLGRLAKPFDCEDLASSIAYAASLTNRDTIRRRAVTRFGPTRVIERHLEAYQAIFSKSTPMV